jgi:hypothetical protein
MRAEEIRRRLPDSARSYRLQSAGRVLQLESRSFKSDAPPQVITRGTVEGFSDKSRVRLHKTVAMLPWVGVPWFFVTLTYPMVFPTDGRVAQRHLRSFYRRWSRAYGAPAGVWKREFQRRGAVHYHLALVAPSDVSVKAMQAWVASVWFDIVKSGDDLHLLAGTSVEVGRYEPSRYFAGHGSHGRDEKGYQNQVPEGFVMPGRWWGLWGVKVEPSEIDLTERQWHQASRLVRRWRKGHASRVRHGGRVQGQWAEVGDGLRFQAELWRALVVMGDAEGPPVIWPGGVSYADERTERAAGATAKVVAGAGENTQGRHVAPVR